MEAPMIASPESESATVPDMVVLDDWAIAGDPKIAVSGSARKQNVFLIAGPMAIE